MADTEKTTGHAVYDKKFLRYVGGVHDTKAKADAEAKRRKLDKYEIREVELR